MQKAILKILLLLISNTLFSQKKDYFFDINNTRITKKEYKLIKDNPMEYLKLTFAVDTAIMHVVEKRELKGMLTGNLQKELILYLNSISDKKADSTKTLIINYYPGTDKCIETANMFYLNELFKDFVDEINTKKNVAQYFIYKTPKGTEFYDEKVKWYLDRDKLIENNFFPAHYPCGSYLIVYPNGKYYIYKGEYNIKTILDKI